MRKRPFLVICLFCALPAAASFMFTGCAQRGNVIVINNDPATVSVVFTQGSQDLSFTLASGASKNCSVVADSYAVTVTNASTGGLVVSWGYVYIGANTTQTLTIP